MKIFGSYANWMWIFWLLGNLDLRAQTLPVFDFTQASVTANWMPDHHLSSLKHTADGMAAAINGADPYFHGPARNYPTNKPLWLIIRLKSDKGGTAQVFFYTRYATEASSVRFYVPAGTWHEARVPLPSLGKGYSLRIDPPGTEGTCVFSKLWFEERIFYSKPEWPRPSVFEAGQNDFVYQSGAVTFRHHPSAAGAFSVAVDGQTMAQGLLKPLIGYIKDQNLRWFSLKEPGRTIIQPGEKELNVRTSTVDPDGATWEFIENFTFGRSNRIDIEVRVMVNQNRDTLHLPIFNILSGPGSFGTNKNQGLFAGVEYLENEPSSSEADLIGPGSQRLVPNSLKITFPLMAIQQNDRYVGLIWEKQNDLCAVFDSPDRQFGSGGHLLGLLFPGSDGMNREEGSLLPYWPKTIIGGQPLVFRAHIIGNRGSSVVPAVQQYVGMKGVPPIPHLPPMAANAESFFSLMAEGWLDSDIRDGNRYRHAAPGFNSMPAADAACWMRWLSGIIAGTNMADRLKKGSDDAIALATPAAYNQAQVGHVRSPVPALVFGAAVENVAAAENHGKALLARFAEDGTVVYASRAGAVDYAKTHWARHANGLTASVLASLLDDALFTGNASLIKESGRLLALLNQYRLTVPRGAQTWEIPLHTPDILASAYLVNAYVRGFQLTGKTNYLEEAKYWAWTGVPFIYLVPPVNQPVGVYSAIPVLGATGWVAPVWIGLPVQWCGLVYASALQQLAEHDASGPWKTLADGIVIAGIQHTYPSTDSSYRGLLPDSYSLESQSRNGPNINPATLLAPAQKTLGAHPIYQFRFLSNRGLRIHAPGSIDLTSDESDRLSFTVNAWPESDAWLVINGFNQSPQVRLQNQSIPLSSPHYFNSAKGVLILRIRGTTRVDIAYPRVGELRIQRLGNPPRIESI